MVHEICILRLFTATLIFLPIHPFVHYLFFLEGRNKDGKILMPCIRPCTEGMKQGNEQKRERDNERFRQTDRQTDRQTNGRTDRQT